MTDDQMAQCNMLSQEGYLTASQARQKRVRTSFKHHQLRTMKSYFTLNHNPDAKDLKQLAQKTGLSKRVLQVWFQNARAKHRRQVMKHDGEKSESGADAQTEGVTRLDGEKSNDSKTFVDISNNSSSEHSNMSSTPSLSDIQNGMAEYEPGTGTRISDLFSSTLNSLN